MVSRLNVSIPGLMGAEGVVCRKRAKPSEVRELFSHTVRSAGKGRDFGNPELIRLVFCRLPVAPNHLPKAVCWLELRLSLTTTTIREYL